MFFLFNTGGSKLCTNPFEKCRLFCIGSNEHEIAESNWHFVSIAAVDRIGTDVNTDDSTVCSHIANGGMLLRSVDWHIDV
jgi:hypothetical protein